MWDPRSYQDTDYGLDGEPFEPKDAAERDDVDLSQPHIMTVLGPITPHELGVCLPHEHVLRHPVPIGHSHPEEQLDRIDLTCQELESFLTVGGRSVVDMTMPDKGRDLAGLHSIAQRVPVHLVATSGTGDFGQAGGGNGDVEASAVAATIRADLASEIKPGLIAFSATDGMTPAKPVVARGAAQAALATGYPLVANSGRGGMAHEHLDLVESTGLDLSRVITGEFTRLPGFNDLLSIARRGAWVSVDWIGRRGPGEDTARAELLVRLAEAGFVGQLLISQGLARRTDFVAYGGGPGWTYLLERFTIELMEAGAGADLVRMLLIDNPARALAIVPLSGT